VYVPAGNAELLKMTATQPLSAALLCFLTIAGESTPFMLITQKPFLLLVSTLDSKDKKATISAE
jgi:hypothetical protein